VAEKAETPLRIVTYEDRAVGMDCLILMAESLCRADPGISLHLTVPDAPAAVLAWAAKWPEVTVSVVRPEGLTGWDVKPWLLLQELGEGRPEVLWIDTDMIVTRPVSRMIAEFPPDALILAQEWDATDAIPMCEFWGMQVGRKIPMLNACILRATQAHRPLLERYLEMTFAPKYREAQKIPIELRPVPVIGDTNLMVALLQSREFCHVPFDYLRLGRHIAQCAGSSGYRPQHRIADLFRGLPPIIHGLGRKPWDPAPAGSRGQRFLFDVATDVNPYVLAARRIARDLDFHPEWLEARTTPGALLRGMAAGHPGMAGLPLAVLHALQLRVGRVAN
jgi:hypothetical protein